MQRIRVQACLGGDRIQQESGPFTGRRDREFILRRRAADLLTYEHLSMDGRCVKIGRARRVFSARTDGKQPPPDDPAIPPARGIILKKGVRTTYFFWNLSEFSPITPLPR